MFFFNCSDLLEALKQQLDRVFQHGKTTCGTSFESTKIELIDSSITPSEIDSLAQNAPHGVRSVQNMVSVTLLFENCGHLREAVSKLLAASSESSSSNSSTSTSTDPTIEIIRMENRHKYPTMLPGPAGFRFLVKVKDLKAADKSSKLVYEYADIVGEVNLFHVDLFKTFYSREDLPNFEKPEVEEVTTSLSGSSPKLETSSFNEDQKIAYIRKLDPTSKFYNSAIYWPEEIVQQLQITGMKQLHYFILELLTQVRRMCRVFQRHKIC